MKFKINIDAQEFEPKTEEEIKELVKEVAAGYNYNDDCVIYFESTYIAAEIPVIVPIRDVLSESEFNDAKGQ